MPLSDVDRVRLLVGEVIPSNGTEENTMFSEAEVDEFLEGGVSVHRAVVYAWRAKAAKYGNLVNVAEGNSLREMSDLYKNASQQLKYWEGVVAEDDQAETEGKRGRVVIGEISRAKQYR